MPKKNRTHKLPVLLALLTASFILLVTGVKNSEEIKQRITPKTPVHSVSLLSGTYVMDGIFNSMQGPSSRLKGVSLLPNKAPELAWVRSIKSTIVEPDGNTPSSQEFFCHANFELDVLESSPSKHNAIFDNTTNMNWRLFTLIAGRQQIKFPKGFGVPMLSNEPLDFFTMSLNQNVPDRTVKARVKANINFLLDEQLKKPQKALFRRALYVLAEINSGNEELADLHANAEDPSASCGPHGGIHTLTKTSGSASLEGIVKRDTGDLTLHWMVPPGKHEYRTDITKNLKLPFDTTAHYVTAHLHPYGERIYLHDVTTNETVFEITAKTMENKLGIESMSEIHSGKGIPLHAGHEYEIVAEYNNPTDKDVDAMGIMYIYLHDKMFKKPDLEKIRAEYQAEKTKNLKLKL